MNSSREGIRGAIGRLKGLGIVIEPGLTGEEVQGIADALGTPLPATRGGFRTPTPSVTWDISPIYLFPAEEFTRRGEDLARKVLFALRRARRCWPSTW
jgi:hypothetical protein